MTIYLIKHSCLLLLLTIFSANSIANIPEITSKKTKSIVVSLVPDITILDWYKRYVALAYQKLGYKVIFKELPFGRAVNLGSKGQVGAMLIRISAIEEKMPEFIRVPVPLAHGKAILYCQKNLACDETQLDNSLNIIGVFSGINFTNNLMVGKQASTYEISTFEQAEKMFLKKRLPYLISLDKTDLGFYIEDHPENFNKVVLAKYQAFHYLHRSHSHLLPELTKALDAAIQEIGPVQ